MGYYVKNAGLIGPGSQSTRVGVHDLDLSRLNSSSVVPITNLYTLAADQTLATTGTGANFGTTVASKITTLQGATCTWQSSFSFNTTSAVTVNATNLTTWSSSGSVCIVWSNYSPSSTKNIATQIISSPYFGRVLTVVFGTQDFTGSYGGSEVSGMPTEFRLINSTGQGFGGGTIVTVQNVTGFSSISGQSMTLDSLCYVGTSITDGSAPTKTVFLKTSSDVPYGSYYKNNSTGAGHAQIMIWPGSMYGFNGSTNYVSLFTDIVAAACVQIR